MGTGEENYVGIEQGIPFRICMECDGTLEGESHKLKEMFHGHRWEKATEEEIAFSEADELGRPYDPFRKKMRR